MASRIDLTDARIRAAKVPPGRATADLFDSLVPGLVLRVSASGRRTFYVWYRDATTRKPKWLIVKDAGLTAHEYPTLKLARARELARELLAHAAAGRDLTAARDEAQAAKQRTFGALAAEYVDKWARPRKKTWRADASSIRTQLAAWHDRPVVDLARRDVRALLDALVARGAATRANRTLALISKILNFGVDRDWVPTNVAARMAKPAPEPKRSRRLSDVEIRALWTWAQTPPPERLDPWAARAWRLNRALLQLRLLTAARGNELLTMKWADLETHDDGIWWAMPVTKNGRPHRLPVTPPAVTVLRTLEPQTPDPEGYVFAGILGKRQRRGVKVPLKDFRPRDLRRTATTHLAALGVDRFTVKRILNHVDREVTAEYDWHAYGPEKRAALEKWAARLQAILTPPPALRLVSRE